jgi:superfamily II DNA/RNA helicase
MPPEIQKLADRFLQNPERIEVAKPASTAKTVTQRFVASHGKDYEKRAVLRDLIRAQTDLKNAIIFCNRKVSVADLFRSLERHGFSVGALHGDMDQRSRTTMLQNFRDGNLQLLVASDVAARGLDIPDVSHVFNFDVPIHSEDYVHRIGRTGRAGRSGAAFTIVTRHDQKYADAIEKLIKGRDKDKSREKDRGRDRRTSHKSDINAGDNGSETMAAARAESVKNERKTEQKPQIGARGNRPYPANDDNRDRRRHRDHDDGPTPVGFGDDIPAFMLIAANAKA